MDKRAYDVLMEHDHGFAEFVAKAASVILDEPVVKMNPAPPDLATRGPAKKPPKTAQPYGILQPTKGVKPVQPPKPKLQPKKQPVTTSASMAKSAAGAAGVLVPVAVGGAAYQGAKRAKYATKDRARGYRLIDNTTDPAKPVRKNDFDIAKMDDEKRQVFGWASVISKNGVPVVDRQGDIIEPEEMEKSAYQYVLESRKGGHQHKRTPTDEPLHVSDMIESMVFTPEKIEKMGLPVTTPVGWWVGFKVHDDETWEKVKKGEVTGFSVHGRGKRKPLD